MKSKKTKVPWKTMDDRILEAIGLLESHGYKEPTIRSVFYIMSDTFKVIPATKGYYKKLDAEMVRMRKEEKIPWGFFTVKRGTESACSRFVTPERYADWCVNAARNAHKDYSLPRWYEQEDLIEVWVEKDGLLGATCNWLSGKDVTVRAVQGYGTWEFIQRAMKDISDQVIRYRKKRVFIYYLGDLDASGKDIIRFMTEDAIAYFTERLDVKHLSFVELALTPEQVKQHKLPSDPEMLSPETLAKMERDPRKKWYLRHYPKMYVELDSFYALATDAVKDLLNITVDKHFEHEVYEETRELEKGFKHQVHDHIRDWITFSDEDEEGGEEEEDDDDEDEGEANEKGEN